MIRLIFAFLLLCTSTWAEPGHSGSVSISTTSIGPSGSLLIKAEGASDKISITAGNFKNVSATYVSTSLIDFTAQGTLMRFPDGGSIASTAGFTKLQGFGTTQLGVDGGAVSIGNNSDITINGSSSSFTNPGTESVGGLLSASGGISATGLTLSSPLSSTSYISASTYYGDGSHLSGIASASPTWASILGIPSVLTDISNSTGNVTVTTVNATNLFGTVKTAAQASIKSLGTLTHLNVSGATGLADVAASGDITATGNVSANKFYGDGSNLTGVSAGAVTSVFGRTGLVTANADDYPASKITNDSGVWGDYVSDALNDLEANKQNDSENLGAIAYMTVEKGKIIVSGATEVSELTVGTDGQVLTADSTATNGISWKAASGSSDRIVSGSTNIIATSSTGIITVSGTISASNVSAPNTLKAWANFDGTATSPITPRDSFNVSQVKRLANGQFEIDFAKPMSNSNYATTTSFGDNTTIGTSDAWLQNVFKPTSSSVVVQFMNFSLAGQNPTLVNVQVTGH